MSTTKKYWMMKSEPGTYSIHDLKKSGKDLWDGVRNYQARNFMMRDMQVGDEVFFIIPAANPLGWPGRLLFQEKPNPIPRLLTPNPGITTPSPTKKIPVGFVWK